MESQHDQVEFTMMKAEWIKYLVAVEILLYRTGCPNGVHLTEHTNHRMIMTNSKWLRWNRESPLATISSGFLNFSMRDRLPPPTWSVDEIDSLWVWAGFHPANSSNDSEKWPIGSNWHARVMQTDYSVFIGQTWKWGSATCDEFIRWPWKSWPLPQRRHLFFSLRKKENRSKSFNISALVLRQKLSGECGGSLSR